MCWNYFAMKWATIQDHKRNSTFLNHEPFYSGKLAKLWWRKLYVTLHYTPISIVTALPKLYYAYYADHIVHVYALRNNNNDNYMYMHMFTINTYMYMFNYM